MTDVTPLKPARAHGEAYRKRRRLFSPPRVLALSIAGLILGGAILLSLPISAVPGQSTSFLDAVFTATSAVCVTGLIVHDTPNHFSAFGQVVIMLLIQFGGLGYMTISTVLAAALGRSVSLQERLTLQEGLNVHGLDGLLRFALTVLKLTLFFELSGALILAVRWTGEMGVAKALWFGLFHSVSAFNNAGFALWSDNLTRWRGDVTVNMVITLLIIAGGLGFFVMAEVFQRNRKARLSVHTRLVLVATGFLLVVGTVGIYALEAGNPRTLAGLGWQEQWLAAWFQSVTPRTAGFNTIDYGQMTAPALFLTMALMFIGASPGSTGGGVKTTTFSITVAALVGDRAWRQRAAHLRPAPDRRARQPRLLRVADCVPGAERRRRHGAVHRAARPDADPVRDDVGVRHGRVCRWAKTARPWRCRRSSRHSARS